MIKKPKMTKEEKAAVKEAERQTNAARQELKYSNREVLTFLNNSAVSLLARREIKESLKPSYLRAIQHLSDACVRDMAEDLIEDSTLSWRDLSFMLVFMAMKIECKLIAGLDNMPFGIFDLEDF